MSPPIFSVIVVTSCNERQRLAYEEELKLRQRQIDGYEGIIAKDTEILSVADPDGVRVGSGGATLNALTHVDKLLKEKYPNENRDLTTERVLILHSGGDAKRTPTCSICGKAFSGLPSTLPIIEGRNDRRVKAPIDFLLKSFQDIAAQSPPGVFIAATDVLLMLPASEVFKYTWKDVTGLAIPLPVDYGTRHGVYKLDETGKVVGFAQKASVESLREDGFVSNDDTVLLDSGVVFLAGTIAKSLRDSYSSIGKHTRFELYSDIMLCMNPKISYEQYLNTSHEGVDENVYQARTFLWKIFRQVPFFGIAPKPSHFLHLGTLEEYVENITGNELFRRNFRIRNRALSFLHEEKKGEEKKSECVILNTISDSSANHKYASIVEHSILSGPVVIGEGSIVSCVTDIDGLQLNPGIALQQVDLDDDSILFTMVGVKDNMKATFSRSGTFLNTTWKNFLQKTGIRVSEIWPGIREKSMSLWNAQLFPIYKKGESAWKKISWMQHVAKNSPDPALVDDWRKRERFSYKRVLQIASPLGMFLKKRNIACQVVMLWAKDVLLSDGEDDVTQPVVSFLEDEASTRVIIFNMLEELRLESQKMAAVSQRVTNTILQLLTSLKRILESQMCIQEEKSGKNQQSVETIHSLRKLDENGNWTKDLTIVRKLCSRYTALHGKVIREAILSSKIAYLKTKPKEIDSWVSIQMSARVDVSGGWSDTPPVCYTNPLGGLVVNIAVRVNGIRPIEIRARRMQKKTIHLRSGDVQVRCSTLKDFDDYNDPSAALSLFKCVLICMGIITLESRSSEKQVQPLSKQLEDGGFEVQVFSSLPHGSGLGSSSILAAGVARALADLVGRSYSVQSLVHLVLAVEQTLTTGGGYQDQVGGLIGGIKSCSTWYGLPVQVTCKKLDGSKIIPLLNKRMLLIFTGKRRIAKGILQSVVNRWSRRSPKVCNLLKEIVENASEMCKAVEKGDLQRFGECLTCYDQQKNRISDGGWTPVDIVVRQKLAPYAAGIGICGAGGGGFMLFVAKNPIDENLLDDIRWKLQNEIRTYGVSLWKCTVDPDGMKTEDIANVEESYKQSYQLEE